MSNHDNSSSQDNSNQPKRPPRKDFDWRRFYRRARSMACFVSPAIAIVRWLF